ncbi:MAG: DUF4115 domain-containing protein [Gammaproteobacteria bacterium]
MASTPATTVFRHNLNGHSRTLYRNRASRRIAESSGSELHVQRQREFQCRHQQHSIAAHPPPSAPAPAVAVPNPTPPTATPATANLPGTHTLALEFSEQCWVEVKDAKGERLLFGVMRGKEKHAERGRAFFHQARQHQRRADQTR